MSLSTIHMPCTMGGLWSDAQVCWLIGSPHDDPSNSRLTTGLHQHTPKLHIVRGNDETASGNCVLSHSMKAQIQLILLKPL